MLCKVQRLGCIVRVVWRLIIVYRRPQKPQQTCPHTSILHTTCIYIRHFRDEIVSENIYVQYIVAINEANETLNNLSMRRPFDSSTGKTLALYLVDIINIEQKHA